MLEKVEQATRTPSEELEKAREDIHALQSLKQSICKVEPIAIDLAYVEETELTSVYLGTTLTKNVAVIESELAQLTGQTFLLEDTVLNPTDSLGTYQLGISLMQLGRCQDAVELSKISRLLGPTGRFVAASCS